MLIFKIFGFFKNSQNICFLKCATQMYLESANNTAPDMMDSRLSEVIPQKIAKKAKTLKTNVL